MRVTLPSGWSIEIPSDFEQIDNGDSWQAVDASASRIVYVSAMSIGGPLDAPNADQLLGGGGAEGGSVEYSNGDLRGRAHVSTENGGSVVEAISAVRGHVATCVI